MKKEELAFQLLVGLTSEYDMLVTALEARVSEFMQHMGNLQGI
jgi:hypothetical protein